MAVLLTGAGGLFTRLGKLGNIQKQAFTYGGAGGQLLLSFDAAIAALTTEYGIASPLAPARDSARQQNWQSVGSVVQTAAQNILLKMVNDDVALPSSTDVSAALQELITQMIAGSATVKLCTVGASATPNAANSGNGTALVSFLRPDGKNSANTFAESGLLTCSNDSQTGGASAGSETFTYQGDQAAANRNDDKWPMGSGAQASIVSVDSLVTGQNLLNNSSFETVAGSGWTGWTIETGAYPTQLISDDTQFYRGTKSVKFISDGATLTAINQAFDSSAAGTASRLTPLTAYGVAVRVRADASPAISAGNLRIALVDGSGTITQDANGSSNVINQLCNAIGTTWTTLTATFRTPRVLPTTGLRLKISFTTAVTSGGKVYVDDVALVPMTRLYSGGPLVALFSGSNKWILNDKFAVSFTNDRGGASFGMTFQSVFDRWFDMRALGLVLPEQSSPSISDSLIA